MWNNNDRHQTVILPPRKGFLTPSLASSAAKASQSPSSTPQSDSKTNSQAKKRDLFHVIHKVPAGNSPYVRAKHVQLIEKDPSRAISLFWSAINAGDRVDSALKDMAVVMKQLNRSDEAIEAIKSFRHLCPLESQESLDNVLVELYKRSGRIDEEIEMLRRKLERIEEGSAFGGRRTKTARSQGKKVVISIVEEKSRIMGNLAWAYLQQNNYKTAEEYYRKALELEPDNNKQCNLAICLLHLNRIPEAKSLLHAVKVLCCAKPMDDSFAKSFERGCQLLREIGTELESEPIEREFYCGNQFENKVNSQDNIAALEGMSLRFGSFGTGNNLEYLRQPVTVDQLKRNRMGMNGMEAQARSSWQRNTEPQAVPWQRREHFSPSPFTQPRRCLWGFGDGDRMKDDWRKKDCSENNDLKKLSPADEVLTEEELPSSSTETPSNTIDSTVSYKKKSWADMAEEEEDGEFDFFASPCWRTQMKSAEEEAFSDENANWNITQESPCLQTQMKRLEQFGFKEEYVSPGLSEASSKSQPVRRALFFNHGKQMGKSPVRGNNVRMSRRNRLKVFQDITQS